MDSGINARKLERIFAKLRNDKNVKAVVLRVDSPGGDGLASDVVDQAVRKCKEKKPVFVSQGGVAASGGYWISMNGTEIFADPTTVTASIGVIGGWIWNKGIGEKLGLTSDHVKIGDHADLGFGISLPLTGIPIPDRNLTSDERAEVKEEFMLGYNGFVEKVAAGRNMEPEAVHEVAQGRVFSGIDGKSKGLVDKIGGLDLAIQAAKAAAGLDPDDQVAIVEYPKIGLINWAGLFGQSQPIPYLRAPVKDAELNAESWGRDYELTYIKALLKSYGRPLYMMPPGVYPSEPPLEAVP